MRELWRFTGPDGPLPHPGSYQFDASVVDSGVFTTVPEAYTPNQDNPQGLPSAPTLGPNPLSGEITGHAFYRFDFPSFVGQAPAAAYSGADQPSTLNWPLLYFVGGDQYTLSADDNLFTDGAEQQDWKYVSIMDGCGQFEIWTEAGYDNLGQSADAGNITAASGSGCSS